MSKRTLETRSPGLVVASPVVRRIAGLMRLAVETLSRTAQPSDRRLAIEERLSIGPKKMLLLVNCCGRRFLFATAGDTIAPMIEVLPIEARTVLEDGPPDVATTRQEGAR